MGENIRNLRPQLITFKAAMLANNDASSGSDAFSKFDVNARINTVSFTLFGVGILLPWNAMLAAMDFYKEQFPSY